MSEFRVILEKMYSQIKLPPYWLFNPQAPAGAAPDMDPIADLSDEQLADLIVNNDGVANLAIDVLTVVFNQQLEKVSKGTLHKRAMSDEFTNEVFASLFAKED